MVKIFSGGTKNRRPAAPFGKTAPACPVAVRPCGPVRAVPALSGTPGTCLPAMSFHAGKPRDPLPSALPSGAAFPPDRDAGHPGHRLMEEAACRHHPIPQGRALPSPCSPAPALAGMGRSRDTTTPQRSGFRPRTQKSPAGAGLAGPGGRSPHGRTSQAGA